MSVHFAKSSFLFASIFLASCGGGGDDSSAPAPAPAPANPPAVAEYLENLKNLGVQIPREIGDERGLLIVDPSTKETTVARGQKNDGGGIEALEKMESVNTTGETNSVEYAGENDRLFHIANGTDISLIRSPSGEWLIEFLDQESGTSFKTNMEPVSQNASEAAKNLRRSHSRERIVELLTASSSNSDRSYAQAVPNSAQIPVTITTSNCGSVADVQGSVQLQLQDGFGKFLGTYSATKTGAGTYVGYIPDVSKETQISLDTVKSTIETTGKALALACQADAASPLLAPQACIAIAAKIAAVGLGASTPIAAKFLAACEIAVATGKLACTAYNKVNLPVPDYVDPASSDIIPTLDGILANVLPSSILNSTVTPVIPGLPFNTSGSPITITNSQPVSGSIDRNTLLVSDITLSPSAPAAGSDYVASATMQCIPFDSSASMSVTGTDGYQDSITKTYPNNVSSDVISLSVPGAESGVRDTVSLTATPRAGTPVSRTAHLVFN